MPRTRLSERLQDLLLENDVLEDFLRQLSVLAAEFAADETGRRMLCSVRVARRARPVVVGASDPEALVLDGLQESRSILAVPLLEDGDTAATLTFFSTSPEAFDDGALAACQALASPAAKAMRLAVRFESACGVNRDLLHAMRSRTTINLATGILMAQSRCSQSEAFELLAKASNTRNVKLRVVAEEILGRFEGGPAETAFSA
ncbi:MAG: GAF and ANTAR domain-containing protein [Arthrobacter sp.]